MRDSPPAKPRRLRQIHLSTAILLMLASSFILWMNAIPKIDMPIQEHGPRHTYGWPWPFHYEWPNTRLRLVQLADEEIQRISANWAQGIEKPTFFERRSNALACDIVIALVLVASTLVGSEFVIRRRKPQP
jgi:hypothetical protein